MLHALVTARISTSTINHQPISHVKNYPFSVTADVIALDLGSQLRSQRIFRHRAGGTACGKLAAMGPAAGYQR
jgi:hypothetical protein